MPDSYRVAFLSEPDFKILRKQAAGSSGSESEEQDSRLVNPLI